ncbi:NAD(P)/FAD-dependent oxidoreductase [Chloroflexota bacterium]
MPDVIVVGAGPAGSIAAKKCAEYGLDTILLEKRSLPREKVCSGMVMGEIAHTIIREEFGGIPPEVLTQPSQLSGYIFHTPGVGSQNLDNFTRLTWRRNLDHWMTQKAEAAGAQLWTGTRVTGIKEKEGGFLVQAEKGGETQEVEARFVIGADGGTSVVRKYLYPNLAVSYGQVFQEHYRGELDLDTSYFHWFYPLEFSPAMFTAHRKDDLIVVDYGGPSGVLKKIMKWAREYLSQNHGVDFNQKPAWRGGCLQPALFRSLIDHSFLPAKGNVLLAGEAGGFVLPISGEGIGTCFKSGLSAVDAVIKAAETGAPADSHYFNGVQPMISAFEEMLPWFKKVITETRSGGRSLPQVVADAYGATLRTF